VIVGKRGVILCASENIEEKLYYIELDTISQILPLKINRSFWLALVDTVEVVVAYNLPLIVGSLSFGFVWLFFFAMYFFWWTWCSFFYGLATFIVISALHLVYPRFSYTFGEIVQICSHNLTFPFLYGFILHDSLGFVVALLFLLFSISTPSRTQQ